MASLIPLDNSAASNIAVLNLGVKFTYQIPSFSVVAVDLRTVKVQFWEEGSVVLCDAFIRADGELNQRATPFFIKLQEYCLVPVEEVAKDVPNTATLSHLPNKQFLVIWQWEWTEEDTCDGTLGSASQGDSLQQDGELSTDSDLTDTDNDTLDTVCCKCVGVTRDPSYQQALEAAYKQLQQGTIVDVKLVPEPNNPYDSRAISFQCLVKQSWKIIGYVVRELCDCIHDAITKHSIVEVKLSWIKYKVIRTTGPGYYAAVNITRKGEWPIIARKYSSTMK